ncbi:hypothetical protein [Candidatus Protochlamydia amoebophila]|uniref:hypothetical protein n=1 Tax=Candidatus Protochlamydia amoebophila TaxID=362787 RepID=UPI0002EFCFE4|nr:hypothetical protein [Candidatus Protochlamydia amoebophila]
MKLFIQPLTNLLTRIRYPTSLPAVVATDLGINISNTLNFQEFISLLTNPNCRPSKLSRFMPREQAENLFQTAIRKGILFFSIILMAGGWNLCFNLMKKQD